MNCDLQSKFYDPHLGVLYGKYDLLDRLRAYKVRPAPGDPPGKYETGTQNHEGIAGTFAAANYLAGIGQAHGAALQTAFLALRGGGWISRRA